MKVTGLHVFIALLGSCLSQAACATTYNWDDEKLWYSAVGSTIGFFNRNAWDPESGTYASEVDRDGRLTSENRDIVALSRMVYANAEAPRDLRDLKRARRTAEFILKKMMARDQYGIFFRSAVDRLGNPVDVARSYTFSFEQSYPIAGLIALYTADREGNSDLLPVIREAAQSYWNRYYDPEKGGLFYYFNFRKNDHSNDDEKTHKSYQSTVYPLSSFLLALRNADPENRRTYDGWIRTLLDITITHIVETSAAGPTGWLIERMNADFLPDETYRMTETGHITQLAWVLGLAASDGIAETAEIKDRYLAIARALLSKFMDRQGFSEIGVVYDAFDRTTGRPWSDSEAGPTSAWWSNLEAIIAFAFAQKYRLLEPTHHARVSLILNKLTGAYFRYFLDGVTGGEFFRVNARTGEIVDGTKGGPGKSGYHITETYKYLFSDPGFASASQPVLQAVRATRLSLGDAISASSR